MQKNNSTAALILGAFLFLGLALLGYQFGRAAIQFKEYERTVTAKGLSEREFPADRVIWPIRFTILGNELSPLYDAVESGNARIRSFLEQKGINGGEITVSPPAITDKLAAQYSGGSRAEFRYTAVQTVTVYSKDVQRVRSIMGSLSELGKAGLAFTGGEYQNQTEYLFTRLNEVKPAMIEEATRKAREVAMKFAADSDSRLGKIRRASQGQFSITPRDRNNPHIKKVRVVSTVEYYLAD